MLTRGLEAPPAAPAAEPASPPPPPRPWYCSKVVLAVLAVALLFIAAHVLLLCRVLVKARKPEPPAGAQPRAHTRARTRSQVHKADPQLLLYPLGALGASSLVAAFAIAVNKMSGAA